MSKTKLLKNNLLMFLGGNIANALTMALSIILVGNIFNLYTVYTGVAQVLLVLSLISMRTFTAYGSGAFTKIIGFVEKHRSKVLILSVIFAFLLIPANSLLITLLPEGTPVTAGLLILLTIVAFFANIFRGIRQHEEDFVRAAASINAEAIGRVVLGYILTVPLGLGISGILIGHIIGFIISFAICFNRKDFETEHNHVSDIGLGIITTTIIFTLGLEVFSNLDIVYANNLYESLIINAGGINTEIGSRLSREILEFNSIQFIRKVIFFGVIAVASVIITAGSKGEHTRKFMMLLTLGIGSFISIGVGVVFFIFHDLVFKLINKPVPDISNLQILLFLVATALMSTSYLLVTWLFSLKEKRFVIIPVIAVLAQVPIFVFTGKDLISLLNAFLYSSIIFAFVTMIGCFVAVKGHNEKEVVLPQIN